jgi:hypothetical protein
MNKKEELISDAIVLSESFNNVDDLFNTADEEIKPTSKKRENKQTQQPETIFKPNYLKILLLIIIVIIFIKAFKVSK